LEKKKQIHRHYQERVRLFIYKECTLLKKAHIEYKQRIAELEFYPQQAHGRYQSSFAGWRRLT